MIDYSALNSTPGLQLIIPVPKSPLQKSPTQKVFDVWAELLYYHKTTQGQFCQVTTSKGKIKNFVIFKGIPTMGNVHMENSIKIKCCSGVPEGATPFFSSVIGTNEYNLTAKQCLDIAVFKKIAPKSYFFNSPEKPIRLFQRYSSEHCLEQVLGWESDRASTAFRLFIGQQLINVFYELHESGISLRALTPNDIVLIDDLFTRQSAYIRDKSYIRIINFSYATDVLTRSRGVFGCSTYNPPEAESNISYASDKADLFILGLILYYIATSDVLKLQIADECTSPDALQKAINTLLDSTTKEPFKQLLKELLQVDPNERISLKWAKILL